MTALRRIRAAVLHPPHLKRTGMVALVVGAWLSIFNEGGQLLTGPWTGQLLVKIALNVLTPFAVANLGLLSRQTGPEPDNPSDGGGVQMWRGGGKDH
ncbi:MAG: hypothetical protein EPN69_00375 [Rhodanobacter sp.]|nr:MAG: hypothetical protein EPN69_00375 [Rhodanobacter sp.]TAM40965.1 MAG: hypothetical protein EPN58_08750 [Rhodanobacter sp.]